MPHFTPPTIAELQAMLPNYQVQQIISHGADSATFSALHTTLGRQVAIKILPQHLSADAAFVASYQRSAQTLASLQHPNVAGVYDFGNVNGMLYSVMEHISGRSLADVVFGQAVSESQAVSLITSLCKGLHKAHQSGILHLDVKPANVLLDDQGNAKIVDFRGTLPSAEEVGAYTAPEITSLPSKVDQRADIFSLGVIFYELLTAQMPAAHVVPASSLVQIDPRLDAIVAKALHPNYEMRYLTCEEMAADIAQLSAAPQNPLMAGAVKLATPPASAAPVATTAPKLQVGGARLNTGAATPQQTSAIGVSAPQATSALAGIAGQATGPVGVNQPTSALAGIAGQATGPVGVNQPTSALAGIAGRPTGTTAGAGMQPLASSQKSGSGMVWMVVGLFVVVGGILVFAMSGDGDDDDDGNAGPTKDEIARKAAAQKAKERDQRAAERLARIKREQAAAKVEEAAAAREESSDKNESKIKKKYIGAWQYEEAGATWRRVLKSDGKSDLYKDGKIVSNGSNYTWMVDGESVKVFKSDGTNAGKITLVEDKIADIFGEHEADKLEIGAKWDLPEEEPKMAANDKKEEKTETPKTDPKKKDETAKKDPAKPSEGQDAIAVIDAEEDVPRSSTKILGLPEPQFDVDNFVKEQNKIFKQKIDEALHSKTQRVGPLTRKLKREMTERLVEWNKGNEGRKALKAVELWLANCESKSKILPLPSTLDAKVKELLQKDIEANSFIINDINKRPLLDIIDLRDEYEYEYRKKAHELRPKNDRGAMLLLEMTAANITRSNKAFINIVWRGKKDVDPDKTDKKK